MRAGGLLVGAQHIHHEHQGVLAGNPDLAVSRGPESILGRDGYQQPGAYSAALQALVKPGDGGPHAQWLRVAGGQLADLLSCGAVPGVGGEIRNGQVTLGYRRAVPADQPLHLQAGWRADLGDRDRWLGAEGPGDRDGGWPCHIDEPGGAKTGHDHHRDRNQQPTPPRTPLGRLALGGRKAACGRACSCCGPPRHACVRACCCCAAEPVRRPAPAAGRDCCGFPAFECHPDSNEVCGVREPPWFRVIGL